VQAVSRRVRVVLQGSRDGQLRRVQAHVGAREVKNGVFDPFTRVDGTPRIDLSLLYPPFLAELRDLLQRCHARGADYYPTKGTRTWAEQSALHHAYTVTKKGTRAAPPGYSAHQFGIAVDCAPDTNLIKPGLQADYTLANYTVLIEECKAMGLHNGHGYKDAPHVSMAGYVTGHQLGALRRVWAASSGDDRARLKQVWRFLDAKRLVA